MTRYDALIADLTLYEIPNLLPVQVWNARPTAESFDVRGRYRGNRNPGESYSLCIRHCCNDSLISTTILVAFFSTIGIAAYSIDYLFPVFANSSPPCLLQFS